MRIKVAVPSPNAEPCAVVSTATGDAPLRREVGLVVLTLTLLYIAAVAIANQRYVWFDELITFDIARSPSLQQLWHRELKFDCNPPTVYLLSRASMSVFGATPLGLRLPSMVEFYLGSMALLLYVRRKAGIAFAALAVLLVWGAAPSLYYAAEARPYALLFMGFAGLLLCWDVAIRRQPRPWALLGVAVCTLALAVAHVFSPFTLFAFVAAEMVRYRRRRVPDYALWAALLVPMLAMVIYLPLIHACGGIIFPVHATYNTPVLFLEETFGPPIISMALLAVLLVPAATDRRETKVRFLPEEGTLLACMFLSPILLSLFLMHRQGTFYSRYCIAAQVTMLVALCLLLADRARPRRWAAYAGSLLVILFILKTQVWHPLQYPAPKNAAFLQSIHPELALVVTEGQVFMEMNQYENAVLLSRVYFLKDPQASMRYLHTNIFQEFEAPDAMRDDGFNFTANIVPYTGFIQQHRQFLLLGIPSQWVFSKLRAQGASIALLGDYRAAMPYFDSTLYLVTLPTP